MVFAKTYPQLSAAERVRINRLLAVSYIVLVAIFLFSVGFTLRLSHLIPLLLPLAFLQGQPKRFLISWAPFYLLILLYDSFRGIADDLGTRVEYIRLIQWEKFLFGAEIPTLWFQRHFLPFLQGWPGHILAIFYFGHFVLPLICLYWGWRKNERAFLCCIFSLCLLCVSGFFAFFLFPAAPPWLASQKGFLAPVQKIIMYHIDLMSCWLPRVYLSLNANPVAAFPSLHAAFPLLWFLCGIRYFPKKWIAPLFINVLGVAIAIVAFGEHYVVDVVAGWCFCLVSFILAEHVLIPFLLKKGVLYFAMQPVSLPANADFPLKPPDPACFE